MVLLKLLSITPYQTWDLLSLTLLSSIYFLRFLGAILPKNSYFPWHKCANPFQWLPPVPTNSEQDTLTWVGSIFPTPFCLSLYSPLCLCFPGTLYASLPPFFCSQGFLGKVARTKLVAFQVTIVFGWLFSSEVFSFHHFCIYVEVYVQGPEINVICPEKY